MKASHWYRIFKCVNELRGEDRFSARTNLVRTGRYYSAYRADVTDPRSQSGPSVDVATSKLLSGYLRKTFYARAEFLYLG